jgi:uroporphyrinogen III methyltransferase/synthase
VLTCPAIRLRDPRDGEPLRRATRRLAAGDFHWLVFTSPAGVKQLRRSLTAEGLAVPAAGEVRPRVAAIGSTTAEAAREAGFGVDVVPDEYRAEALAAAIVRAAGAADGEGREAMAGLRVLLPRAAEARDVLPRDLEAAGASVEEVPAYEAVRPEEGEMDELAEAVSEGRLDWVTFTASSIVRSYVERVGTELGGTRVAVIGPVTAETARSLGLAVHAVAGQYTVDGLVEALVRAEAPEAPSGARRVR